MNGVRISALTASLLLIAAGAVARPDARKAHEAAHAEARRIVDALPKFEASPSPFVLPADTLPPTDSLSRYDTLSDRDFAIVAQQLGVEVAAIKAVVVIEAGTQMQGFWAPGVPVVNFDRSMFNRFRSKGSPIKDKGLLTVPKGLKGYALSEWTQLVNARKISGSGADLGTFWGMFQIGGFNYRICGCQSVEEFVRRMSASEFEQLELFAEFITKSGMVADLRNKNWAGFARKYNGPSYAKRGYHTKMANAYAKYSKK